MKPARRTIYLTLLTAVVVGAFLVPQAVEAQRGVGARASGVGAPGSGQGFFDCVLNPEECTASLVAGLFSIFTHIFGLVLALGAFIINWAFGVGGFTTMPAVTTGWAIARDLSNMFFIAVLLAIAFATILRVESYGIKRLLPRLIVVALLINFSLLGAGAVIDVANDLGVFFTTGGQPGIDVASNMMAALGVQRTFDVKKGLNFLANEGGSAFAIVANAFFNMVFTLLAAFLFIALGLMLVGRMVVLWVLLIFLPFALVATILPNTKRAWGAWWKKFATWAFFPAVVGFFIYFALLVAQGMEGFNFGGNDPRAHELRGDLGSVGFSLVTLLQYVAVLAIMFMGMVQAQKWGIAGAETTMKWANNAKGYALKQTKDYSKRKATAGAGRLTEAALYKKDEKTGQRTVARGLTKGISRVPGLGKTLTPFMKVSEARKKQIETRQGDFEKMSAHHLQTILRSTSGDDAVAIGLALAKKNKFDTKSKLLSEEKIASIQRSATPLGLEKELILSNAEIAIAKNVIGNNHQLTIERVGEIVSKARPNEVEKFAPNMLTSVKGQLSSAEFDDFIGKIIETWGSAHVQKMSDENQNQNLHEFDEALVRLGGTPDERAVTLRAIDNHNLANFIERNPAAASFLRAAEWPPGAGPQPTPAPAPAAPAGGAGGGGYPPGTVLGPGGQPVAGPGAVGASPGGAPPKPGVSGTTPGGTRFTDRRSTAGT